MKWEGECLSRIWMFVRLEKAKGPQVSLETDFLVYNKHKSQTFRLTPSSPSHTFTELFQKVHMLPLVKMSYIHLYSNGPSLVPLSLWNSNTAQQCLLLLIPLIIVMNWVSRPPLIFLKGYKWIVFMLQRHLTLSAGNCPDTTTCASIKITLPGGWARFAVGCIIHYSW